MKMIVVQQNDYMMLQIKQMPNILLTLLNRERRFV